MADEPSILSFSGVTVEADALYDSGIWNVTLRLDAGEMALVRLERGHLRLPLADAAQGLIEPAEGSVSFLGADWRSLSADEAAACRGRIGRVFDAAGGRHGWVSDLNVDENVVLSALQHTDRPDREIADEAAKLARMFGLPGLPRGRPDRTRPHDLQLAGCVRALMGQPRLIILERPTQGTYPELLPPLVNALRNARRRGAAVLWTTAEPTIWTNPGLRPSYKCAMSGAQMLVSREEPPRVDTAKET